MPIFSKTLKLITAAASALLLASALSACTSGGKPVEPVEVSAVPEVGFELVHEIRYWPEDADYDTCDYACIVEKPVFSRSYTAGANMNLAVDQYIEELYARIESKYVPAAVAAPPYTEVSCGVHTHGGYTGIVFTEEHFYEAQPFTLTRVLMLNARGEQANINDIYKTYHAQELLAAAMPEIMLGSLEHCYDGITAEMLLPYIDVNRGALADENGCTVYLPEGVFAPYELGELSVCVPDLALMPDFVGEAITLEEYGSIIELTDCICGAVIVREENIEGSQLTPYSATAFMGALVQRQGHAPDKGRIELSANEFTGLYRGCFGGEFPGIDSDGFDIKLTDKGAYSVSASQKPYEYHLDMLTASWQGEVLVITGDMWFGAYGSAYSVPVNHVTCRLVRNSESVYGFTVTDFIMGL